MPYTIQKDEQHLALVLSGGVTARDVSDLAKCLASSFATGAAIVVRAPELDDIDTSVLQMLVSLRKTAASFEVESPSEAFVSAVDRCALRRELLAAGKDAL